MDVIAVSKPTNKDFRDLEGQRFGKLVAKAYLGRAKHSKNKWLCQCDCGNTCIVNDNSLICKYTRSCGCLRKDNSHYKEGTPEYNSWHSMMTRCYNPNCENYHRYGGRGIGVCERWLGKGGFKVFLQDMGEKPSPECSIDRKDNDGNYEPTNCKWSTIIEQSRNTSKNRIIEYNGEKRCLQEWSEILNINPHTIRSRLKHKWSIEDTFTRPVGPNGIKKKHDGV